MRSAALLLLLPLAACVSVTNDDPTLSDGTRLATTLPPIENPAAMQADPPSVTGLSRENWAQTTFSVPQREVTHQPIYRSRPVSLTSETAYQRGDYPTPETAGQFPHDSEGAQRAEAALEPLLSFADLFLMIPRAVMLPPLSPVRGPTVPVDRVPPALPQPAVAAPAKAEPASPAQPVPAAETGK